jgi:hypothetical protein
MNYRKNMFALLVAGTLITGCGGGGTDISGGSSGGSTGGTTSGSTRDWVNCYCWTRCFDCG